MPGLPFQKLEIPLGIGLQTDVDDKLLPVGKVVALENGVWLRGGEIVKRTGSAFLGSQYAAGTPGTMPPAWQLATHKDALVTLSKAGPRPIGVMSPSLNKWMAPAGSLASDNINGVSSKLRGQVLPRRTPVYRSNAVGGSSNIVNAPDFASNGTYELVVWTEENVSAGTSSLKSQIVEIATGKTLFTSSIAGGTAANTSCRAVFANGDFQMVYIIGANVRVVLWSLTNIAAGLGAASSPFTLATDASSPSMDVIANGVTTLVIYNAATTRIIRSTSGTSITVSNLTEGGGGAIGVGVHAWVSDLMGAGLVAAVTSNAAGGVRVQWAINTGTGTTSTTYTLDGAAGQVTAISAHTISSGITGEVVALWHIFTSGTPNASWGKRTVASGTQTGSWILSCQIASKTFLHNTEFYNMVSYDSDEQGTLFAIRVPTTFTDATDGNRTPSARFCTGQATRIATQMPVPSIYALSADSFLAVANVKVREVSIAGANIGFNTGVDMIKLTFNPTNVNSPREFADNLYVCGGVLGAFDGMTFAEEGFHLFPPAPTLAQAAFGLLTLTGTYLVCAVYRYTDEFGRQRRSAPSTQTSITLTGANGTINATAKTLKLHGRGSPGGIASKVVIEFYQTVVNEPTLYYLAAVALNDESVDTVTVSLVAADSVTLAAEQLYTGNPAGISRDANEPPPPALSVTPYKDRLAVIAADDPTLVWVSLPLSEVNGPEFTAANTFRVDDGRGDLTGHAAIDDRLIEFKSDVVYFVPGDGADAQGNGTFGIPQIIGTGVGCSEPRSIVQTPDGVMFRSSSERMGIHMVNRGLAIEYIGAAVQQYLDATTTIVDAMHFPALMRTEFFTNVGITLVYDHMTKLWSTASGQSALAMTEYNGRRAYQTISSNMSLAVDRTQNDTYDDTSSPVDMYVETPWVSFAQLKGYLRFQKIQLVGATHILPDVGSSGYKITMTLWKNFDKTTPWVTQSIELAETDDINLVELRYSAKVTSLKIAIRISQKSGESTNFVGPKLTAIAVYYATKTGLRPIPTTGVLT